MKFQTVLVALVSTAALAAPAPATTGSTSTSTSTDSSTSQLPTISAQSVLNKIGLFLSTISDSNGNIDLQKIDDMAQNMLGMAQSSGLLDQLQGVVQNLVQGGST